MLDRLFPSHLGNLERGLDRAVQRQGLLMGNLANANVPGYKRKDMDFDIALRDQMGLGKTFGVGGVAGGPDGAPVENEASVRVDGSSVDPEKESLGIAETELRYQTLTDLTSGFFSGLKNVIREGK